MKEIADLLRQKREEQQMSLEQISEQTKIQVRLLMALEAGDPTPFPGEVYVKGALRNYANAVGLDPEEVLQKYKTWRTESSAESEEEKRKDKQKSVPNYSGDTPPVYSRFSIPVIPIILVLIIIAVGAWYLMGTDEERDALNDRYDNNGESVLQDDNADADQNNGEDAREEEEEEVEVEEPSLVKEEESAQETRFSLTNAHEGIMSIAIDFNARCWVDIHVDGERFTQREYGSGDELRLEAQERFWIRAGNLPAVSIKVDGLEIPGLSEMPDTHNISVVLQD